MITQPKIFSRAQGSFFHPGGESGDKYYGVCNVILYHRHIFIFLFVISDLNSFTALLMITGILHRGLTITQSLLDLQSHSAFSIQHPATVQSTK